MEKKVFEIDSMRGLVASYGKHFEIYDKDGELFTSASPNQDNPISEGTGNMPIMCIDVWEHAYYLKYRNLRGDYIKALFNVIDWKAVEENYRNAMK